MKAIKGYFSALGAIFVSLTHSAAGIAALILLGLCIPLNVAALMHLFEWQWWLALPAALVLLLIPVVGWLAIVILAGLGGYFLYDTGFDWRALKQPVRQPGSFASMTIMEFDSYRRTIMPEGLTKACKEAQSKLLGMTSDQLPVRASNYCECYGQTSADTLTQADLINQEVTGTYSEDATARMRAAVHSRCGS